MAYSKVVLCGDTLETYIYENNLPIRRSAKRKCRKSRLKSRYFRGDNVYRKKRSFVRLIRSNLYGSERPCFMSLTMLQVLPLGHAYKVFSGFIQSLRVYYGKSFRYISVPEFQKRGAVHFHLLIWGISEREILNERLSRNFQHIWQMGFVDCLVTDGSVKLAYYLGKYLVKAQLDRRLLGQKAFVCSRNVVRPRVLPFETAVSFSKEIWEIDLSTDLPLLSKEFQSEWLGKGRYNLYKF